VSVAALPAAEDAPVRAEELIDISMDSPVGDEEDTAAPGTVRAL